MLSALLRDPRSSKGPIASCSPSCAIILVGTCLYCNTWIGLLRQQDCKPLVHKLNPIWVVHSMHLVANKQVLGHLLGHEMQSQEQLQDWHQSLWLQNTWECTHFVSTATYCCCPCLGVSPEAAEAGAAAGPDEEALSVEAGVFGRGQEPVALQAAFTVSAWIFLPKAFSARSDSVLKPASMQHKWYQLVQDKMKRLL